MPSMFRTGTTRVQKETAMSEHSSSARSGVVMPKFYSVAQAAQIFGMSPMTLYRAIAAGEFPAVRIRGRLIIPAKAVDTLVDVATAQHTVVDTAGGARVSAQGGGQA